MAEQLRTLEDLSSIPSAYLVTYKHLELQSRGSDALFWPMKD